MEWPNELRRCCRAMLDALLVLVCLRCTPRAPGIVVAVSLQIVRKSHPAYGVSSGASITVPV
jgi:hypothetical protein